MKARILGALAAVALIGGTVATTSAAAQTASASINADAIVQQALSASGLGLLDFGAVFPGTAKSVLPSDAAAGSFQITGAPNAEITVTFPSLPAQLVDIVVPANTLPIAFAATDASRNNTNNRTVGTTVFDPGTGDTGRLDATTGEMYVFIGGTVTVGTQPAGTYRAQITLNAAYTGN